MKIDDNLTLGSLADGSSQRPNRRIRVLFADDDDDTLQLLAVAAKRIGGFEYCLAHDGGEVADCLESDTFDVLCLDAEMPVAYGTTIARMVRDRDISLPIIFFTGRTGREVRLAAEEVDATLVEKPAPVGYLMELIQKLADARMNYHGPERRKCSINTTSHRRRATDRPFTLPEPLRAIAVRRRTGFSIL